ALVTSSFVLVDDALVGHTVDHRHSQGVGGLGFGQIFGVDSLDYVLDVGTHHRAQACVVAAALLSLIGAFFGGGGVGHRRAPRTLGSTNTCAANHSDPRLGCHAPMAATGRWSDRLALA